MKTTSQQKTRLSASSLTENNANALCSDLSMNTIPKKTSIVKCSNVDPTGIEPANSDYSDPNVHQHRAHKFSIAGVQNLNKIAANDSSGNARTGTINSGTWKPGKFGGGVKLNGNTGSDISVSDF